MRNKILLLLFSFEVVFPGSSIAQVISLKSLLTDMINFESVARWSRPPYMLKQTSSYDRKSVSPEKPGWFANADASQYIRAEEKNGHTENVMLDVDGPGAIVRFWLTTFKRNGILRIYFDGKPDAGIEIPAYDLMKLNFGLGKALLNAHSSYEATEKGGSTLYLPLPFAKHCKITFEDHDLENKQPRYYQINYRAYTKNTHVETFSASQLPSLKSLIDEVDNKLWTPPMDNGTRQTEGRQIIKPLGEFSINLPSGPAAVRQLIISIKTSKEQDYAQALRSTVLKIAFDGHQTVWCPVGDFSGSGVGGKKLQSWYRTVDGAGKITSRWIMPYEHAAKISFINLTNVDVEIAVETGTSRWQWDPSTMYFHASWKQSRNVQIKKSEEEKPIEWNFNSIKGKGVYVGNTLAVYNHMHKWYGEGDQKIWIDNEKFPSEFGTGTEDYYNTSWAPVVVYQTPFANAPRADSPDSYGFNTFTRTRILDAVPFAKSFVMNLEMLGWENGEADFAVTTYWYGFEDAIDNCGNVDVEASVDLN